MNAANSYLKASLLHATLDVVPVFQCMLLDERDCARWAAVRRVCAVEFEASIARARCVGTRLRHASGSVCLSVRFETPCVALENVVALGPAEMFESPEAVCKIDRKEDRREGRLVGNVAICQKI